MSAEIGPFFNLFPPKTEPSENRLTNKTGRDTVPPHKQPFGMGQTVV
jgi:hypothetical protein